MFKKIRNFIDRLEGSIPLDEVDDQETEIPKETKINNAIELYIKDRNNFFFGMPFQLTAHILRLVGHDPW